MNALGRTLQTLLGAGGPEAGEKGEKSSEKPSEADAPAGKANPYQERDAQFLKTVSWLIAALAGVATVMVAGSQLSSIGRLTVEDDRLTVAAVSVAVAVALVVLAIGLLTWVQMPERAGIARLREQSSKPKALVTRTVANDPALNRGEEGLGELLNAFATASADYQGARREAQEAALAVVVATTDEERAAAEQERDSWRAREELYGARLADYGDGVRAASQLDIHIRTQRKSVLVTAAVLALATVAAMAFIVFAWASNPPEDDAASPDAVAARPVEAVLVLTDDDAVWTARLGEACAQAARSVGGVPVVATASSDDGVEVVVLTSAQCPEPVAVTIPAAAGTVTAVADALG